MESVKPVILFVYRTAFHPLRGGVERVTESLAKALLEKGYKVLFLHSKRDTEIADYAYAAPTYYFPTKSYFSKENIEFYHRFLKEKKIDIVINQSGYYRASNLYLNTGNPAIKTITVIHSAPMAGYDMLWSGITDLPQLTGKQKYNRLIRILKFPLTKTYTYLWLLRHYRVLEKHSDIVCILSAHFKQELQRVYKGSEKNIRVIPNPFPGTPLEYNTSKKKQLLYVGRLDYTQKRPDRLISIWGKLYKEFPEWELIFVGDGPARQLLEKQASQYERITFTGYQVPDQYYKDAMLFCLTSDFEGFAMSLLEAIQAFAVPTSFNSYASVHDVIIDQETGILATPFNTDEYAEKLRKLMNNESEIKRIAFQAAKHSKDFEISNILPLWEKLFKELQAK